MQAADFNLYVNQDLFCVKFQHVFFLSLPLSPFFEGGGHGALFVHFVIPALGWQMKFSSYANSGIFTYFLYSLIC